MWLHLSMILLYSSKNSYYCTHNIQYKFLPPLTSCLPLGEKASEVIGDVPPDMRRTQLPFWISQRRQVLSCDPVAKYLPLQWNLATFNKYNKIAIKCVIISYKMYNYNTIGVYFYCSIMYIKEWLEFTLTLAVWPANTRRGKTRSVVHSLAVWSSDEDTKYTSTGLHWE